MYSEQIPTVASSEVCNHVVPTVTNKLGIEILSTTEASPGQAILESLESKSVASVCKFICLLYRGMQHTGLNVPGSSNEPQGHTPANK